MNSSRRRHARQRRQLRRAVRFLHSTHDVPTFDPVAYIEALSPDQIARLARDRRVSLLRLSHATRVRVRAWAERNGVHLP
jgi:hypothetical protein